MGCFSLIQISIFNFPDPEMILENEKVEFVMKTTCMFNVLVFAGQVFDIMTGMSFFV